MARHRLHALKPIMRLPAAIAVYFAAALAVAGAELHVGMGRKFSTITRAIAEAAPGDTITVHGGRHAEGTIHIVKPLLLVGAEGAVLDGASKHEIMLVSAPDVTVRGFTLRDGGRSSTREFAGIRIESAERVTISGNKLVNCDYGIYLARARKCSVLRNDIEGLRDRELNGGNGIHLWSSEGVHVQGNHVSGHRDGVYLEFSSQSSVEDNVVEDNLRYGLHFMTCHDSSYRKNRFSRNGAGVAVMYSRHVEMTGNVFEFSWGGSAYGLLIKDITDSTISGNRFNRNSTAIYCQGATRTAFERNDFHENGWALRILASGDENRFVDNNFSRNSFDVTTNGQLVNHAFSGNYWDRYEGYDLKHDGTGDVPFRPVSLYAIITERVPASLFLLHSFMIHLLDRAEKAFPTITPDSVVDSSPAMRPHSL